MPFLRDESGQTVYRFTMGEGTRGLPREAYYAGWQVVGNLQVKGYSLAEVARVQAEALPDLVEKTLLELLND